MPAGLSFDLFGTLVAVDRPDDPAEAVGAALAAAGVSVPEDWPAAYRESHDDRPAGAEHPLSEHVTAALASRGVEADPAVIRRALREAFDATARPRPGAGRAVRAAATTGPVGVLSNCAVRGLVERTLADAGLEGFDAVVTSVGCGYRKPDRRAFAAVADELGVPVEELVHVGDDPATDGAAAEAGARAVLLDEVSLSELPAWLEAP